MRTPRPTLVLGGLLAAATSAAAAGLPAGAATAHPAPAATPTGHTWTSPTLDGAVYARPVVSGHTVVVATENDTLYGLDLGTGAVRWSRHVGTPVPRSSLPCGNIDPLGITGAPAVSGGVAFAVAEELTGTTIAHVLVGVSVASGALVSQQAADAPGSDPTAEQQRPALKIDGGNVVIDYGGLAGDCSDYHGYVVTLPTSGAGTLTSWHDTPNGREGGAWAPFGPVIASDGSIYLATGNGSVTTTGQPYDDSDATIHLSPSLQLLDYFAPSSWVSDNAQDLDIGSVSPVLLPDGDVFQAGKSGNGYLLSASHLGGIGGQLATAQVCAGSEAIGGMAYADQRVFVSCGSGLTAVRITSTSSFKVAWHTSTGATGAPEVAGGLVWSADYSARTLDGISPSTGALVRSFPLHGPVTFATAQKAQGSLLFPDGDVVDSWALG